MLASAWAYILTNHPRHTTLYAGSTIDLPTRLWEHQTRQNPKSFTARYNVTKLIYYEPFENIEDAVKRERFIKGKNRKWKEALINRSNPEWKDLSEEMMRECGSGQAFEKRGLRAPIYLSTFQPLNFSDFANFSNF